MSCPDMIYADFTILQKGCHNIVDIMALSYVYECCHNVVEMFSYNFCGNIVATFLKLSWNMCQRFHNFPPTLLQLYIVSYTPRRPPPHSCHISRICFSLRPTVKMAVTLPPSSMPWNVVVVDEQSSDRALAPPRTRAIHKKKHHISK